MGVPKLRLVFRPAHLADVPTCPQLSQTHPVPVRTSHSCLMAPAWARRLLKQPEPFSDLRRGRPCDTATEVSKRW